MIKQIEDVTRDIKVCLDENTDSEQLLATADIDTLALEDIIRSKIVDAVRRVHADAPAHLLEQGHNFGDAIFWREMESGYVMLPDDFFRLVVFEMDDWERAVYSAISADDPEYAKQRSRFKALRGTAEKPVCAIVIHPEGLALEFYSCKSESAQIAKAVYLPKPEIDNDGGIDICERCYQAVVYMAAALVLATIGEKEKSATMNELSITALK